MTGENHGVARLEHLEGMLADAIRAAVDAERERCLAWIDRYWSFNDCQQHTHTWHSREDCRDRIRSGELL